MVKASGNASDAQKEGDSVKQAAQAIQVILLLAFAALFCAAGLVTCSSAIRHWSPEHQAAAATATAIAPREERRV
jgi:TRAP-type C4-dicarboxylate transport system permease small subunit